MTSATLGAFSGGGVGSYAASYDLLGRLTSESATYTPSGGSASTLYSAQPTYDALGNVIESVTTLPQGTDTQVFCYDDLSRLTWAGSSGTPTCSGAPTPSDTGSLSGTGGAQYSASYSYDVLNRLTSGPLGSYTYGDAAHVDAATAIGSAWTASYDAVGDMTCRAATSATTCAGSSPTGAPLAYDNEGQLATWLSAPTNPTSSASYLYDGEGQRVEQVATTNGTTTTTAYIGSLEEIATTGGTTTTTAYYGKTALSVNGTLSYTLSDGLGSVSESVNATTGAVTASQLYAPYGAVRYASGALPGSRGFTGQHSDAATSGLDYYGARYYDPLAGQFTSADTTLAGGLNRYAYVAGNPESATDPSGYFPKPLLEFPTFGRGTDINGLVDLLWRENGTIGDGGTFDALLNESQTLTQVGGRWHYVKTLNAINTMERWQTSYQNRIDHLQTKIARASDNGSSPDEVSAWQAELDGLQQNTGPVDAVNTMLTDARAAVAAWEQPTNPLYTPGKNPPKPGTGSDGSTDGSGGGGASGAESGGVGSQGGGSSNTTETLDLRQQLESQQWDGWQQQLNSAADGPLVTPAPVGPGTSGSPDSAGSSSDGASQTAWWSDDLPNPETEPVEYFFFAMVEDGE